MLRPGMVARWVPGGPKRWLFDLCPKQGEVIVCRARGIEGNGRFDCGEQAGGGLVLMRSVRGDGAENNTRRSLGAAATFSLSSGRDAAVGILRRRARLQRTRDIVGFDTSSPVAPNDTDCQASRTPSRPMLPGTATVAISGTAG